MFVVDGIFGALGEKSVQLQRKKIFLDNKIFRTCTAFIKAI